MKIKSKIAITLLVFLLLANSSSAQTKMTNYVTRKTQEAERYEQILHHIETAPSVGQITETGARGVACGSVTYVLATKSALAGTAIGTAATATGVVAGVAGVALLAYGGKRFYQSITYFQGKDRASQYPTVARALTKGKVFAQYKVILVNGPVITKNEATLKHLASFLGNPRSPRVLWTEIGPEQDYRFYFDYPANRPDLANRQIYADVDVGRKIILVRTPNLLTKGDKTDNYFIEPMKK